MRRRGLTVMETMIACAILSGMMVASLIIYSSGLNRQRKQENTTESYRAVMTAVAHIRSQLRGSQLLSPGTSDGAVPTAVYRFPRMVGDLPKVDAMGMIIWRQPSTFQVNGGVLERTGTDPRKFVDLGPDGTITFERKDRRLLRLVVKAEKVNADVRKQSKYEAQVDIYLPNN